MKKEKVRYEKERKDSFLRKDEKRKDGWTDSTKRKLAK